MYRWLVLWIEMERILLDVQGGQETGRRLVLEVTNGSMEDVRLNGRFKRISYAVQRLAYSIITHVA